MHDAQISQQIQKNESCLVELGSDLKKNQLNKIAGTRFETPRRECVHLVHSACMMNKKILFPLESEPANVQFFRPRRGQRIQNGHGNKEERIKQVRKNK